MNPRVPGVLLAAALLYGAARGHAALAWLVSTPLLLACSSPRTSLGRAAALGTTFALGFAVPTHAPWLAEAARRYFDFGPAAGLAIALALCVGCAVPFGTLLGIGLGSAGRLPGVLLPVVAGGATWVACESVTRAIVPYYPWIGLAATQADVAAVRQLASLAGQAAVSFVVAACGCALALVVLPDECEDASPSRRSRRGRALLAALLLAGGTFAHGALRLAQAPGAAPGARTTASGDGCTIAAVDAGIERGDLAADVVLARYGAVTTRAAATRPDAIVWPESALPGDPLSTPELLARLRDLTRESGAVLLAGGPRVAYDAGWTAQRYNALFRIAATGPVEIYDKREPVPFAERWPRGFGALPSWLALDPVVAGERTGLLRLGACTAGVLICFEVERPALALAAAASGADVLVVASNDAELPERAIAIEVAESRLRAVETGLPLLRAANRGASVAIDRYGRTEPALDGVTVLRVGAAVPAAAVRWSSRFLVLCWLTVAATVLAALIRTATSRRDRRASRRD